MSGFQRHEGRSLLERGVKAAGPLRFFRQALSQSCRWRLATLLMLVCLSAGAAEVMPPAPPRHFNDYANVVSPATATQLNQLLENFERETSNQIVVAVFPKMQSDSSIEDYTFRVAQSWRVGQAERNNGAVLFVFIQDRQMFLQVGYGLEGALPDAIAKRIIEDEIKPHFRAAAYDAGLTAGVNAILQATRGEYRGSGRTVGDRRDSAAKRGIPLLAFLIALIVLSSRIGRMSRAVVYRGSGRSSWGGSWGGGGWGGGGFRGGGGSFGGGGAGGRW